MAIENPHFLRLQSAITPVISIGVGSAICTACSRLKIDPSKIESKDIGNIKQALIQHYKQFWAQKLTDIERALSSIN